MKQLLEYFSNAAWMNIIFLVLTLFSIALAYYFYYKSKREKTLVYSSRSFWLVKPDESILQNIEIKYKGTLVNRLTLTQLALWNKGTDPIKRGDVAAQNPLIISAGPDVIIYDIEVIHKKDVNNFQLSLSQKKVNIDFDFIDKNDGIVMNIFHDGQYSWDVEVSGTIIGGRPVEHGIKRDIVGSKIANFFFKPVIYLFDRKSIIAKLVGALLTIPTTALSFPFLAVSLPIDFIYNIVSSNIPRQFDLTDR